MKQKFMIVNFRFTIVNMEFSTILANILPKWNFSPFMENIPHTDLFDEM